MNKKIGLKRNEAKLIHCVRGQEEDFVLAT